MRDVDSVRMVVHHVDLQKALNAVQPFEDQLVARVKLDSGFSVDAFRTQLRAELTLRLGAFTSRFPRTAYLALRRKTMNQDHMASL